MPGKNTEIAKRSIELFNAGGIEAAMPCFPADVVVYPFPEWIEQPTYRGHDGLRAIMAVWTENFDDFQIVPSELHEFGDRAVMLGETTGRIKGVSIRQPIGVAYADFRDGQIGEFRNFLSWQQALNAVGIEEPPGEPR